jgi:flagellar protein FliO/FliZ
MDTLLIALRVALSLAAVVGLLWFLQRRVQKGTRRGARASLVTVVGRQGLGQKASVVVVDVEGRRFVLGVTEQSVTVLHDGETPAEGFATSLHAADAGADGSPASPLRFPHAAPVMAGGGSPLGGADGRPLITADAEPAPSATASAADSDAAAVPAPLTFRPRHDRGAGAPLRQESGPGSSSRPNRLAGSILSPATWQQTAAALRQGR